MIDPTDPSLVPQDEDTSIEPPDTTATADALGGNANLPKVDYDPTTHADDPTQTSKA